MTDASGSHRTVAHAAPTCHDPEENLAMHMARKLDAFEWTLEELHRLPDDGNKYELVRGELFVTPAPSPEHERLAVVLTDILIDYVRREKLGRVFHPRSVVRFQGSEVEPDVMVRPWTEHSTSWEEAPAPLLVIEILSDVTRRRDRGPKREFYLAARVAEYWIVDAETRTIQVVQGETEDVVATGSITWRPSGAVDPLTFDVQSMFRDAIGP
jgi:Uma2 family endonuclease